MRIVHAFAAAVMSIIAITSTSESVQLNRDRSLVVDGYKNIVFMSSTGTPNAITSDLQSAIDTRIELKLRIAGLKPTKSQSGFTDGLLEIQTDRMELGESVFKACVKFERNVAWSNPTSNEIFHAVVPVWEQCVIGTVGTSRDIQLIPEALDGTMDIFLNQYLKANQNN